MIYGVFQPSRELPSGSTNSAQSERPSCGSAAASCSRREGGVTILEALGVAAHKVQAGSAGCGFDAGSGVSLQQAEQRVAGRALQLLRVDRPIVVRIGALEEDLDIGKVLVLADRLVVVRVGDRPVLG